MSILKSLGFGTIILFASFILNGQTNLVPQQMPCFSINSQNAESINGNVVGYKCITIGGETNNTHLNAGTNNQVDLKAGEQISVEENSHISATDNGSVHASIQPYSVPTVWYEPNETAGFVEKHRRMELGFRLPSDITAEINSFLSGGIGINPYDPDQINFRIHLEGPDGSITERYAFYFQPFKELLAGTTSNPSTYKNEYVADTTSFPWRFRFAPPVTGTWKVSIVVIIPGHSSITQQNITFVCLPSNHKGELRVIDWQDDSDRYLFYSESNEPFYAFAENISSAGLDGYVPSQNHRQLDAIQKLADVGGNYTRFELGGQAALPDWPVYNNYNTKQDEMYGFDKIIDKCEDNDIYFTIFRHHIEVWDFNMTWSNLVNWNANPYKVAFGCSPQGYFENADVLAAQKKTLRYVFSRWGYSPNWAMVSFSEVDNWGSKLIKDTLQGQKEVNGVMVNKINDGGDKTEDESAQIVKNWVLDQQNYIKQELGYNKLFTYSHASINHDREKDSETSFCEISDVISLHKYDDKTKGTNFKKKFGRFDLVDEYFYLGTLQNLKKPIFYEEIGLWNVILNCCTGIEFHNNLWSTAFMGTIGIGMDWWWDQGTFDKEYQIDIWRAKQFFNGVNFWSNKYQPKKWADQSDNNQENINEQKIENFYLVAENKESVLGWMHNSKFYWRNIVNANSCLSEMYNNYDSLENINGTCYFGLDPYGYPPNSSDLPQMYNDVYHHEVGDDLILSSFNDDYTGDTDLSLDSESEFEIHDLKLTGFFNWIAFNKEWYQLDFYNVHGPSVNVVYDTRIVHTNAFGTLHVQIPCTMGTENTADFAYKVTYLGHDNDKSVIIDTTLIMKEPLNTENDSNEVVLYPNPNQGEFTVKLLEPITDVFVYNLNGEIVYTSKNVNSNILEIKIDSNHKGLFFVSIKSISNQVFNKKIIIQ